MPGALQFVSASDTRHRADVPDDDGSRPALGYGDYVPVRTVDPDPETELANALYAGVMAAIAALVVAATIAVAFLIA